MDKDQKLNEVLSRGVEAVFPSREMAVAQLSSGKSKTIYLGIDPTGPTLHLGHAINLLRLKKLQSLGHKVILLIGDFTAMIGDPTDKLAARKRLSRKEVLANAKLYRKQASIFLNFWGRNKAELRYNSKWLSKMTFERVIDLASHMTVQQMLERDMFSERQKSGKPIYLHEFLYPLMQGYDAVAMEVDGEIGGNDQTFNMLVGRNLAKELIGKDKFVIASKLLVDPLGKKMGKTEGNMVTLMDGAETMVGKIMSWTDGMIMPGFELCTEVSLERMTQIESRLKAGENPRDLKLELAEEIAAIYHGREKAVAAKEAFLATFSKGEVPEDAPEVELGAGTLLEALISAGAVASKNDGRRLIGEGAIRDAHTDEKVTSHDFRPTASGTYRVGKRRFVKVVVR